MIPCFIMLFTLDSPLHSLVLLLTAPVPLFFAFWIFRRQCRHFALASLLHHCFEPGPCSFHYSSSHQFIFSVSRVICTPYLPLFCTAKRTASLRSFTQPPDSHRAPMAFLRMLVLLSLLSHALKRVSSVLALSLIGLASFHYAYNPNVYVV